MVFDAIVAKEDLESYDEAFCVVKSEDFILVSTNMDTTGLYFLLDQLKMSLITGENTNYNGRISRIHT